MRTAVTWLMLAALVSVIPAGCFAACPMFQPAVKHGCCAKAELAQQNGHCPKPSSPAPVNPASCPMVCPYMALETKTTGVIPPANDFVLPLEVLSATVMPIPELSWDPLSGDSPPADTGKLFLRLRVLLI